MPAVYELITLNLRGENHEKELPEDADVISSGGVFPLEALFVRLIKTLFQYTEYIDKEGVSKNEKERIIF